MEIKSEVYTPSPASSHIMTVEENGVGVARLQLLIAPNLAPEHECKPFAVIENVLTYPGNEGKGYATALIKAAIEAARKAGCYKVFLTADAGDERVAHMCESLGLSKDEKTAYNLFL